MVEEQFQFLMGLLLWSGPYSLFHGEPFDLRNAEKGHGL